MLKIVTCHTDHDGNPISMNTYSPLMFRAMGVEFVQNSHKVFIKYSDIFSVEEISDEDAENRYANTQDNAWNGEYLQEYNADSKGSN